MIGVLVLILCASGAAFFFKKEIRIAYHRNRMFAAGVNYTLLNSHGQPRTLLVFLKSSVFRMSGMSAYTEGEAMFQHENALIKLGYLEKHEFTFTNKVLKGDGHCWPSFRHQITNTFGERHWWSGAILETNRLAITARPEDLPKWEKLISDFDR